MPAVYRHRSPLATRATGDPDIARGIMSLPLLLLAACSSAREDGEIFVLRDFRAGKNSFIESTKRNNGAWTGPGYRETLVDLTGPGSVRHIWATDDTPGAQVELEVYVDGESRPSLHGTMAELIAGATALSACPAPRCVVEHPEDHRDQNLYTPIPFTKSIRIDAVQKTQEVGLFFSQIDYRTQDESLNGARLLQDGEGAGLRLRYRGWSPSGKSTPSASTVVFPGISLVPGEMTRLGEVTGGGVVRALRLTAPLRKAVWLHIRYEGSPVDAFAAPLADVVGNFDGEYLKRVDWGHAEIRLPMPFREKIEIYLENRDTSPADVSGEADVESVAFGKDWGWLHGAYHTGPLTNGHHPHPVLYVRGRGRWLGMILYDTGHDHGGGDFAVVDGESSSPAFLHGINGEDYFNFAWFGTGNHFPYAASRGVGPGRYRLHLENPYPFQHSFQMEWGTFPDLLPRSLALWYQDRPDAVEVNTTDVSETWDVFGPIMLPPNTSQETQYLKLPAVAELDAGMVFPIRLLRGESFESGWMQEESVGASLNLTYIARHGTKVAGERVLNGNGDVYLARKKFNASTARVLEATLSYDDPLEVRLNGKLLFQARESANGFVSVPLQMPVVAGANELEIRLTNYYNRNFNWAGFGLWLEEKGRAVRLSDLGG